MERLTQEFIDELLATQEKLDNMYEKLDDFIRERETWKETNLGAKLNLIDGEITHVRIVNDRLYVDSYVYDYDSDYGYPCSASYYDHESSYSLIELMTDDWKEHALKEYQKELEKKQEEQRIKEETLAQEAEAKERAEYERLKAKYGN